MLQTVGECFYTLQELEDNWRGGPQELEDKWRGGPQELEDKLKTNFDGQCLKICRKKVSE